MPQFFWMLLIAVSCPLVSNGQGSIIGKTIDTSGQPLPFTNVLILTQNDSSLVKGAASDLDGQFKLSDVEYGKYLLKGSSIGFIDQWQMVDLSSAQLTIPDIMLEEDVAQLDELMVEALKPLFERQADRTVVNVANSATAAGGTALEVLERSPGVMVDKQNNSLSMLGKAGVLVMINGKVSRLPMDAVVQMLSGMSSDNIEKIELITTPPASFDAEGDAGVINIVLKEHSDAGTSGNIGLSAGHNLKGDVLGGSLNLNHRKERFSYFVDYSIRTDKNETTWNNYRVINDEDFQRTVTSNSLRSPRTTVQNLRTGMTYDLSKKTSLELMTTGFRRNWQMDALTTDVNVAAPDSTLTTEMDLVETNIWMNLGVNLGLNHKFSDTRSLSADFDYLWYNNYNPSNYQNTVNDSKRDITAFGVIDVTKDTPINFQIGKVDYVDQLTDELKLETGLKASLSEFVNDVQVRRSSNEIWTTDERLSNYSTLEERVYAGYGMARWTPKGKWSYSAGLRYEFTDSYLSTPEQPGLVDREFGNFFPTLTAAYSIKEGSSLNLAYNRRITRPSFRDMAPFVFFVGPNTFIAGNPSLLPAITDGLDLSYQRNSFFTSLKFSHTANSIGWLQPYVDPETNEQILRSENIEYLNAIAWTSSYPWHVTRWLDVTPNLTLLYEQFQTNHLEFNQSGQNLNAQFNAMASVMLPKAFTFEASGWYRSRAIRGVWVSQPIGAVNLAVKKELKGNNGTLTLGVNDVFKTIQWRWFAEFSDLNARAESVGDLNRRVFRIHYSRRFGNSKLKSVKIESGAQEERNRVD